MLVAHFKRITLRIPLLRTKKKKKITGFKIKQSLLHTCTSREKASTMMFSFFWFSLTSRISPNIKKQLHRNHRKHFLCMYVNNGEHALYNTQWGIFHYNSNKNHFVITPELNFHCHVN